MKRKIDIDKVVKCEKCGAYRWRTIVKTKIYKCRNCNYIKNIKIDQE